MGSYTIPNVVERTPQGERSYDVFSRLLSERIIFLGTEIDDGVANVVIAQLLHLESSAPESEIAVYINSPGGSFTSLMAIYDTMTFVQAPISTFCVGQAASTAAVLLAAGDPGRRFVLEHARVLLGQPASGGRQGTVSDLALQAKEMVRIRSQVEEVLARHTHHDVASLRADMDRDKVFTAPEAVAYGLADEVLARRLARVERPGRRPASGGAPARAPVQAARHIPSKRAPDAPRPVLAASPAPVCREVRRISSPCARASRSARPSPRAPAAAARTSEDASLRPRSTSDR
ncbi:ATP-dependent Clp protease proteolytic subunit [Streptomyces tendae]